MIYLETNDVLLFQGDSITNGGRVESTWDMNHIMGHGYQDFVAQTLGVDNIARNPKIINRGVSGDTIQRIYDRRKEDVLDLHPTIMSILDGTNDATSYIEKGADLSPARYGEIYRALLDAALKENPALKLIIGQPFRYVMPNCKNKTLAEEIVADVRERSSITEKIAEDYGAVYVRFWDALDAYAKKYPIERIIWDGTHPTFVGHGVMARCWLETVESQMQ